MEGKRRGSRGELEGKGRGREGEVEGKWREVERRRGDSVPILMLTPMGRYIFIGRYIL